MRASNEKKIEAEKLFYKGLKLAAIAKKLEIPEGTVRSWKNRGKWGEKTSKKINAVLQKNETEKNATLQKKKRGGQPRNKNAKGSKGGSGSAPLRNKNAEKHGAYSKMYFDSLDAEEWNLIDSMENEEEQHLIMQLQMFSVRERRLMKNIKKYQEIEKENHGLAIEEISKTKNIEDLMSIDGESIGSGKYKKVKETTVTKTKAVINSIMALEIELTKVQRAKTKAIDALAKIRLEKQKLKSENSNDDAVDDWIAAVLGKEIESDE